MKNTLTTSQDLIPAIKKHLVRIGAYDTETGSGLEITFTSDFTVLEVFDNQEAAFISVDTALTWHDRLANIPSQVDGFETAWQELASIKNWEISD